MYSFTHTEIANENLQVMKRNGFIQMGKISDGYHSFDELYEHRIVLYIALLQSLPIKPWMSRHHSDGTSLPGYFVLGVFVEEGSQITYHLPDSYWDKCREFAELLDKAPQYDGHTSQDVLERIAKLYLLERV